MGRRLRVPVVLVLLTLETVMVAGLAAAVLPAGPPHFQQSAFYSAFLTGDEATSGPLSLIPLAGVLALGALLAVSILHLVAAVRQRRRYLAPPPRTGDGASNGKAAPRFDLHQRTQHILLFSCVGVLALTGLPQALPEGTARGMGLALFGGEAAARSAHRAAAAVLDFTVFYHIGYLLVRTLAARRLPAALLPDWSRRPRSRSGRAGAPPGGFTAGQKLDYWTVAICVPAMTLTGLALVHADLAQQYLPAGTVAFAAVLHRAIAALLVAYVLAVHFSHVLWSPDVFPFSPAMFTGRQRAGSAPEPEATPAPAVRVAGIAERVRG